MNDAVTKSGSCASTTSSAGLFSARRLTLSFCAAKVGSTGSVHVAVPTIRSATPSESRISVEPWLSETMRCGSLLSVTVAPQFSMDIG